MLTSLEKSLIKKVIGGLSSDPRLKSHVCILKTIVEASDEDHDKHDLRGITTLAAVVTVGVLALIAYTQYYV